MLETADSEKLELRSTVLALRKELAGKAGQGRVAEADMSRLSVGQGGASKKGRDPADVRKIEDLKRALSDLQESMNKRYPDSVATLIQASKLSDSVQAEQANKEQRLGEAQV